MFDKSKIKEKVILMILDGWGLAPASKGNAIARADTPFFDSLRAHSFTKLCAHGECVGLPKGQPGNSEAGHLNLGAGRVVLDDAVYISKTIKDGRFFKNPAFLEGIRHLKKTKGKVHLMGLITEDNSPHSCPEHWLAMIDFLDKQNIKEVYLHLFTDGRDSGQHAAPKILERFETKMNNHHKNNNHSIKVKIASVAGRFFAMDRTKTWERIEKVYDLMVLGKGFKADSGKEAILQGYNRKETDEFISPTVIEKNKKPVAKVEDGDLMFFLNLRSDRARQLTKAFVQDDFLKQNPKTFKRKKFPNTFFVALTDFGPNLGGARVAYPSTEIKQSLPVVLDGIKQLYVSETEKYAHVTFFFNGGYDKPVSKEDRLLIDSPNVMSYREAPFMKAEEIVKAILKKTKEKDYKFITVNFPNGDMLGHTGDIKAAIKGLTFLDKKVKNLTKKMRKKGYIVVVTADHGGPEEMINPKTKEIETRHTSNPVPFAIISDKDYKLKKSGKLSDVAPTILDIFGIKKPDIMTGNSLIKK